MSRQSLRAVPCWRVPVRTQRMTPPRASRRCDDDGWRAPRRVSCRHVASPIARAAARRSGDGAPGPGADGRRGTHLRGVRRRAGRVADALRLPRHRPDRGRRGPLPGDLRRRPPQVGPGQRLRPPVRLRPHDDDEPLHLLAPPPVARGAADRPAGDAGREPGHPGPLVPGGQRRRALAAAGDPVRADADHPRAALLRGPDRGPGRRGARRGGAAAANRDPQPAGRAAYSRP